MQNRNVIGIAFNLIIIRTAANRAEEMATHCIGEKLTSLAFDSQPVVSMNNTASVETDDVTVYL
jgi:hypothetical protein